MTGVQTCALPIYTATELADILWDRARQALRPGAVDDGVVGLCAALAAAEHGDARRALDLLRVAAEVAEREGCERVEVEHVRRAQQLIERDVSRKLSHPSPYTAA